jgi:hypothetical protein
MLIDSVMLISDMGILFVLLVVVGALVLVLLPRRELSSRTLSLLRCLYPAWRFFEEIAPAPGLSHRVAVPGQELGPWVASLSAPTRGLGSLWLNARGNLYLACQSLVECLDDELETAEQARLVVSDGLSYRLVQALVSARIRATSALPPGSQYQFQLTDWSDAQRPLFLSDVHTL